MRGRRDPVYPRGMVHVCARGGPGVCLLVVACTGAPEPAKQAAMVEAKAEPVKVEAKAPEPVKQAEPVPVVPPVAEPVKAGAPAGEQFMFVFRGDVAVAPTAEEAWGTGKVRFKKTKEGLEGRRDVDTARLPEALRGLDGAAVTLYGAGGKVCEGTLRGLSLYGLSERGDEEEREHPDELPSMPALMAGLADAKGSCDGALWARRSELPAPAVYVKEKADAAQVARARAATEKLTAYAALATSYGEYAREMKDRVTFAKFAAKQFRAAVWRAADGRMLVATEVGDPENVRCEANFSESLAGLFVVEGDTLRVLTETGPWQPEALFDADGDGAIEVLVPAPGGLGGILIAATRKEGEALGELRFPSEGLGCGGDEMGDEP